MSLEDYDKLCEDLIPYVEKARKISIPFLDNYKLLHFWYSRFYPDGSIIDIGIDTAWHRYSFKNKYFDFEKHLGIYLNFPPKKEVRLILTPKNIFQASSKDIEEIINRYKIFYMFNILVSKGHYIENFGFSAPPENPEVLYIYTRYFGILKAFGNFFKNRFTSEINEIERIGRISFTTFTNQKKNELAANFSLKQEQIDAENNWVENNIKYFYLSTSKGDFPMSPKQKQCLSLLAQGKTFKEIGNTLVKPNTKTAEAHILRLRDKTGLTRAELIQSFIQSGL